MNEPSKELMSKLEHELRRLAKKYDVTLIVDCNSGSDSEPAAIAFHVTGTKPAGSYEAVGNRFNRAAQRLLTSGFKLIDGFGNKMLVETDAVSEGEKQ